MGGYGGGRVCRLPVPESVMNQAALGDQAVVTTGGDIGSASDMSSGWGGSGGTAVGSSGNNPGFTPQDNNDWAKDAINAAIAYGWDPIQANNAISGYVYGSGIALNEQQSSILRWVLGKIGAPPDPIASPPPTTPAPVPGPPSTPTPTPTPPPIPASVPQGHMWTPAGDLVPTPVGGAQSMTVWDPSGNPHQVPVTGPIPLGWYDAPPSTWAH
jgi:hypothetical protein